MGFLASFLGKFFADEFRAWLPWVQQRLVRSAVLRLSPDERTRYNEEWRSHLNEMPGELAKTWTAFGFLRAARRISAGESLLVRVGGLLLYLWFMFLNSATSVMWTIYSRRLYILKTPSGKIESYSRHAHIGRILYRSFNLDANPSFYYPCSCFPTLFNFERIWRARKVLLSRGCLFMGAYSTVNCLRMIVEKQQKKK